MAEIQSVFQMNGIAGGVPERGLSRSGVGQKPNKLAYNPISRGRPVRLIRCWPNHGIARRQTAGPRAVQKVSCKSARDQTQVHWRI